MKSILFVMIVLFAAAASAQSNFSSYLGPGILRRSANEVGSRGGEQVDLRFYLGLNGTVENGYQSASTDSNGNLINPGPLTGVSLTGGVYGVHTWKRALLGIDYAGNLSHYVGDSKYDSSANNLQLAYTLRPSQRLSLDFREGAFEYTRGSAGYFTNSSDPNAIAAASLLDSRFFGLSSDAIATYQMDVRNSITVGGGGRFQYRRTETSVQTIGFNTVGGIQHRLNAHSSVGVNYFYSRDQARDDSFSSSVHTFLGRYVVQVGPAWTLNLGGGVYIADIDQRVAFDLPPALAVIFGTNTLILPTQNRKIGPSVDASITRQFKRSSFSLNVSRSVLGGAGSYVTSETDNAGASYTYSASRKWNFGVNASELRIRGIGTAFGKYHVLLGGAGFTYELFPALHLVATYEVRHLDVSETNYTRNPSQGTVGLTFSPGSIPLAFR